MCHWLRDITLSSDAIESNHSRNRAINRRCEWTLKIKHYLTLTMDDSVVISRRGTYQ